MNRDDKATKATPLRPTEPPQYPISTSKEGRKWNTNRKDITKDSESRHASGDSSEEKDGIEDPEPSHTSEDSSEDQDGTEGPGSSNASGDSSEEKDGIEDPEPSHTSGDSSEEQDGTEDSRGEKSIGRHDDDVTTLRQRYRTFNTQIPDRGAAQGSPSMSGEIAVAQAHAGSFPSFIANDGWTLIKTVQRLLMILYPFCKWVLLGYAVWMAITYLVTSMYRSRTAALAPMCSIPVVGPQMPFCTVSFESKNRFVNVSKVATSQDTLAVVMDRVGQNFDLARDMVGHEFAVRDLKIRVAASDLSRKKELTQELESLIRYTKRTAKGLSRFTAKVSKSIDTVKDFDEYAVKALEGIAEQQQNPSTLSSRIILAISPFAAFSIANKDYIEEQVKHIFIVTAARISDKVKLLIDDSFDLARNLNIIQEILDRIKELAVDEIGDVPQRDILSALWTRLARADDNEQHKSHTSMLTDMTEFYEKSSYVMRETAAALNRVKTEMSGFRDDLSAPGLILKENPLEVIIALLRKSGQLLEVGKTKLEQIEEGRRPRGNGVQKTSGRTVTAILL